MVDTKDTAIVRSTCRICYNSCGVLIYLEGGRPVKIEGDPQNPMSKGRLCPKGSASLEYLNHPARLKHPLRRTAKRGDGKWQPITWDEALETVAGELRSISGRHGILSVAFLRGASKGLPDSYMARFANIFGTPNISSPAPVCFVPGVNASKLTYGYYAYPDHEHRPRCIVVWGANPEATNVAEYEEIVEAAKKGARIIAIDPIENELTKMADLWLRPRPGTDLALCLGIMNVIVNENLYDRDFVDQWTIGFPELNAHLQDYPPEQVAEITWVSEEMIRKAARLYTKEKPGLILWGNGIETTLNSFQACRAIAILRSISGNLGVPGGEVKYSSPGGLPKSDPEFVCQDSIPPDTRAKRLSMKDNLMPIVYYALPQRVIKAILEDDPYPVRAIYQQGGNLLTAYTNAKETYNALIKLEFLVVADLFMTPTAMLADVVLPAATYLEYDSVEQPWHFPIVSAQQKVAQVGESWPDGKILNELAKRMGFSNYVWDDMNQALDRVLKPAGVTFEEFREIVTLVGTKLYRHYEKGGFETLSKKVELYSERLKEWGFDPLPEYREAPETPLSDPRMAEEYPFVLTTRKGDVFRHSGGRQIPSLRSKRPQPILKMHPQPAENLGIKEGDWVHISTKRGRIRQKVTLVDSLDPRTIEADYAWWFPEKDTSSLFGWDESNINILTSDKPPYNREMGSAIMRGISCKVSKV
ncbi:MAG: molybdopterin-dependent oxidoreductase [Proteobacteria bacterium]|nr:molybdopterin-dependent oxidoreductase [Pseudomonadota bacterium]NIS70531.1 molybdopterin-dependent oxidoreductase [Pseudomonadota bacterium]